jgi:hypothetical protein
MVEKFERLEHQSALKTKQILRKYFSQKDWDAVPFAYVPDDFLSHYVIQQLSGHSNRIHTRYASIFPDQTYRGTLGKPIPEDEKKYLQALVDIKSRKKDKNSNVAAQALEQLNLLHQYFSTRAKDEGADGLFSRILQHSEQIEKIIDSE